MAWSGVVVCVSWDDAVAFCEWLSRENGKTYRLPTEAEWEYSCRSGNTARWCFGDNETELEKYAWYERRGGGSIESVGGKLPNSFGLFDMHGNVREWCSDWFSTDYYSLSPVDNPKKPSTGNQRVTRNGLYASSPQGVRSAQRDNDVPTSGFNNVGFRPVQTIPVGHLSFDISEPNATVSIDNGQSTFTTSGDGQPVGTMLIEGKHTL